MIARATAAATAGAAAIAAAAVATAVLLVPGTAGAATSAAAPPPECEGLMVCVPVKGPWVKIPAPRAGLAQRVEWELACPEDYVIGGTAARVSSSTVTVSVEGLTGSPVGPGVTTKTALVFVGTYTGSARVPTSFRPALGCVPAAGGGGRPSQVSYTADFAPFDGLDARRSEDRVRRGGATGVTVTCQAGGRLLRATHAVGFAGDAPPTAAVLGSVRSAQRIAESSIAGTARATAALPARQLVTLQVRALCTQGFQ